MMVFGMVVCVGLGALLGFCIGTSIVWMIEGRR